MDVYAWLRRSMPRPKNVSTSSNGGDKKKKKQLQEDNVEFYGITDKLIEFLNTFTIDTFKTFPLMEEDEANCGEGSKEIGGNVRKDLSEWQERHATIVLSKSKLRAIQLARLGQMTIENDTVQSNSACEVEMSETKQAHNLENGEG